MSSVKTIPLAGAPPSTRFTLKIVSVPDCHLGQASGNYLPFCDFGGDTEVSQVRQRRVVMDDCRRANNSARRLRDPHMVFPGDCTVKGVDQNVNGFQARQRMHYIRRPQGQDCLSVSRLESPH